VNETTSIEAYLNGREGAERDIAAGRVALELFVSPWGGGDRGAAILKERFGIESKVVVADLFFAGEREHAEGYNEIMREEIERRFGLGVIEQADAEAEATSKWPTIPQEPAWNILLKAAALPFLFVVCALAWLLFDLPGDLRKRIQEERTLRQSKRKNSRSYCKSD